MPSPASGRGSAAFPSAVVLVHNANRTVPDFLDSGEWQPRASLATLASAMDVGDPSNMERLRALHPQLSELRHAVRAFSVDDAAIRARIRADFAAYGQVWCPHTATAAEVFTRLSAAERRERRWCIVSTAHPAKFAEVVEPLIGRPVDVPEALSELFRREPEQGDRGHAERAAGGDGFVSQEGVRRS